MIMLFVFSCKTWNIVKPGSWSARPPPGSQQSQDFSPILPKVLRVLHSQQAVTPCHSQLGQCPGRLEARSEACSALSLKPKQDYSCNFPNTCLSSGTNRSLGSFDWRMALETKIWVLVSSLILRWADYFVFTSLFFLSLNWSIVELQCCVNFLLYSKVTQLYIYSF